MPYKNPEKRKEYYKKYNQKYRLEHHDEMKLYGQVWRKKLRKMIFDKYGRRCKRCGISDERVLQIDHVNGGGTKEKRQYIQRPTYYIKILKDESGKYQVLCANCNWIKRAERKEMNLSGKKII